MFKQPKTDPVTFKIDTYTVEWYPSDRFCLDSKTQRIRPKKVPPLMVRKAEWRR